MKRYGQRGEEPLHFQQAEQILERTTSMTEHMPAQNSPKDGLR
jgi:hypothetical protein